MIVNYRSIHNDCTDEELEEHAQWLARDWSDGILPGKIGTHGNAEDYPGYTSVDVLGSEFVWMNETFTREKFTWYLWF